MITEFVTLFDANRGALREGFKTNKPMGYDDIVKRVVNILDSAEDDYCPDPERITCIDHGDYQGTLLFVIGAKGYQPHTYWYVSMHYGSCSACDSFQDAMRDWPYADDENPEVPDALIDKLMSLALHVVQRMKAME